MTNPLETARKNLHKRYHLLAQDLGRVVSMLTLHEHTSFKTVQPAIDILQELITGLTDSERLADNDHMVFGTPAPADNTPIENDADRLNKVITQLRKLRVDFIRKHGEEPTHIFMSRYVYHNLMQLYGIGRYCELPHTNEGNPPKLLGMTVVLTTSGAANQVFLSGFSDIYLTK